MLPTNETSWFSRSSSGRIWRGVAACVTFLALASAGVAAQTPSPDEVAVQEVERLFDEFQFEPAIAGLDLLLGRLSAAPSRPDATGIDAIRAVMSRAHELRARARFNLGQLAEADADFEALVRLDAGYRLADDMSPRVLEAFDLVRSRLVGLVFLTMDPPGQVTIDDRVYFMASPRETFEVVTGDHTVTASLPGYRDAVRDITIERGGGSVSLEVVLTRVSGSLTVATVPAGVEVVVDQEARGQTRPGIRDTGPSSPVLVLDLLPGQHRLRLVRDCYAVYDVPFNIPEPPVDVDVGAIELQPAVATATIVSAGPEALVYLDGERRGPASEPIAGICEGPHVVEVRSSEGRFIDRRDWRAGDAVTLDASLRQAFALIDTDDGTGTLNREVAGLVEAAVGDARSVMVFVPIESELAAAAASGGDSPAVPSLTTAQRRTSGEQWTARLDVQGVAWLSPDAAGSDAYRLNLLAGGSGVPDVIPLRLSDLGSRAAAAQALSVTPSAIVRTSLQASVVDVAGVTGAAVVRVVEGGTSAGAGLAAGDVIFNVGQTAVAAAGDLRAVLDRTGPGEPLSLNVRGPQGERSVSVLVAEVPDAIPPSDRTLLSNILLLDMRAAAAAAETPLAEAAARLNLAIAHIRLTNWDLAIRELEQVSLPDGSGVAAGTVDYLLGLCLTEISRLTDAQAAFRRAATTDSHLFIGGPPVAALAEQRLSEMLR